MILSRIASRRRFIAGLAALPACALAIAPACAELIVLESNVDWLKVDTRLEEGALPRLPRGAIVKVFNTRTRTTSDIKGPPVPSDSEIGSTRDK